MFETVLSPAAEATFKVLSRQGFMRSFYLAGGTGCALHIGHRRSEDFDFFSPVEFDIVHLHNALRNLGRFVADYTDAGTLVGRLDGTKISLFHYRYPLLEETAVCLGGRVAALVDIGCMKIDAVSSRGTKRDFVDLFFIHKTLGHDLKTFFGHFERKYGPDGFNRIMSSRASSFSKMPTRSLSLKCWRIFHGPPRSAFSSRTLRPTARFNRRSSGRTGEGVRPAISLRIGSSRA